MIFSDRSMQWRSEGGIPLQMTFVYRQKSRSFIGNKFFFQKKFVLIYILLKHSYATVRRFRSVFWHLRLTDRIGLLYGHFYFVQISFGVLKLCAFNDDSLTCAKRWWHVVWKMHKYDLILALYGITNLEKSFVCGLTFVSAEQNVH